MKHYTETIPVTLAEKLKEKGMPMEVWQAWATPYISVIENSEYDWLDKELGNEPSKVEKRYAVPSYAEVFDWLRDIGIEVEVYLSMTRLDAAKKPVQKIYAWNVFSRHSEANGEEDEMSWHEAANAAIEKALELIKQ